MKNRLEVVTNVLLICAAVLVCGVVTFNQLFAGKRDVGHDLVGKTLPIKQLSKDLKGDTAVLVLSTTCGYCAASMPFYRKMLTEHPKRNVVAVFPQSQQVTREYLRQNDLPFPQVVSDPGLVGRVSATPTILIMDEAGKVKRVWTGRLGKAKEAEVLAYLM